MHKQYKLVRIEEIRYDNEMFYGKFVLKEINKKTDDLFQIGLGYPIERFSEITKLDTILVKENDVNLYINSNIKFYFDPNNKECELSEYVFCIRYEDSNMNMIAFDKNGELVGYASEHYDNFNYGMKKINEITATTFMHEFVKPLIKNKKENTK